MLNGSHYPKTWILQSLSSLDVIDNPFIIMFPPGIFLIVKWSWFEIDTLFIAQTRSIQSFSSRRSSRKSNILSMNVNNYVIMQAATFM